MLSLNDTCLMYQCTIVPRSSCQVRALKQAGSLHVIKCSWSHIGAFKSNNNNNNNNNNETEM